MQKGEGHGLRQRIALLTPQTFCWCLALRRAVAGPKIPGNPADFPTGLGTTGVIPEELDQATGMERRELLETMAGNDVSVAQTARGSGRIGCGRVLEVPCVAPESPFPPTAPRPGWLLWLVRRRWSPHGHARGLGVNNAGAPGGAF